jgi:hypothetical protein
MNSTDPWVRASIDGPAPQQPSNAGAARLARAIDHAQIARRAYQIYESHARSDGRADEDWRQAEAEYAMQRANELAAAREASSAAYDNRASHPRR